MKCKYIYKNLIGYIEQTIPANLHEEIDNHINSCRSCEELYNNVFATYHIADVNIVPEVNPFFYTRLEQKLKTKVDREITFVPKLILKLQPIAITILIVVGISTGILIGKNISVSTLNVNPDRSEILEAYASDYYLINTGEESMDALINNE
jgi:hypothetical protein